MFTRKKPLPPLPPRPWMIVVRSAHDSDDTFIAADRDGRPHVFTAFPWGRPCWEGILVRRYHPGKGFPCIRKRGGRFVVGWNGRLKLAGWVDFGQGQADEVLQALWEWDRAVPEGGDGGTELVPLDRSRLRAIDETATRERYAGCLWAQAHLDAMGALLDGQSPLACLEFIGTELAEGRFVTTPGFPSVSADTRRALALLEGVVADRRFDAAAAARRMAAVAPAAPPADEDDVGGVVSGAALGGLFPGDPAALVRAAQDLGRATGASPLVTAGVVAIGGAVAAGLRGEGCRRHEVVREIAALVEPIAPAFAAEIASLDGWFREDVRVAMPALRAAGDPSSGEPPSEADGRVMTRRVRPNVLYALWAALANPDDPEVVFARALFPGGALRATAALTGAIVGANHGACIVGEGLRDRIAQDAGAALGPLAERLWDQAGRAITAARLAALER